jgi:hypothetical protein
LIRPVLSYLAVATATWQHWPAGPLESLCLEEYITGVPVQASLQAANQQAGGAYRWRHLTKTIFAFLIYM